MRRVYSYRTRPNSWSRPTYLGVDIQNILYGGSAELPAPNSTTKYKYQCGGSEKDYAPIVFGIHLASQIRRGRWCAVNSFFADGFVELGVVLWKDQVCEGTGY